MKKSNKFGFGPMDTKNDTPARARSVGPMGAAVREAAESLQETTEVKIEQRRRNAEDAKAWRAAQDEGRVLVSLPLDEISTDDLPRDRLDLDGVAASDEMEELKSSIRARGQKEPVEVYRDGSGRYQLKKGWRRLTALRQLRGESGDAAFAHVVARVEDGASDRIARYVDMVEENVVREDLSFAEMAQVALAAAADPAVEGSDPEELVGRLYGALHKMKRSYIRSFVFLMRQLGDDLRWPKDVSRNLGVEVARQLRSGTDLSVLRRALAGCARREDQAATLQAFVDGGRDDQAVRPARGAASPKQKFEFHVGEMKVTARQGECRIVSREDFTEVPRDRLERAIRAFGDALRQGEGPRITTLGNPRVTEPDPGDEA